MPPRKRNSENTGLPKRWRHMHNAYYYRVPSGLEHLWDGKRQFRLGRTLTEAYRAWAERLETPDEIRTIGELLDRYALQVLPGKAPKSRREQIPIVNRLKKVFGTMPLNAIEPQHVYQYVDKRTAKTAAIREIEVLRHALTKAAEWGLTKSNPLLGQLQLRGRKPQPRVRYIEDWELQEALSLPSRQKRGSVGMIQAYIRVKLLTGLRRTDLLCLQVDDLLDSGIYVKPRKTEHTTGKELIITWSDELRTAVQAALEMRPVTTSSWVFCTRKGESYFSEVEGTANGFDSIWQRFMRRLLSETRLEHRFAERDLRAKCASDATSLEHAQQLLAHADQKTTLRWYRRKPEKVKPLR